MQPAFRSTPELDIGLEWGGRFVYWAYVRMTRPTWALSCIGMANNNNGAFSDLAIRSCRRKDLTEETLREARHGGGSVPECGAKN